MKYLYDISGGIQPCIMEFSIEPSTFILKGDCVSIVNDKIIRKTSSNKAIGIAMEQHTGEEDEYNLRNNGEKIRVCISPGGIYAVKALSFEAQGTQTGKLLFPYDLFDSESLSSLSGSVIKYVKKSDQSTNSDTIGKTLTIKEINLQNNTIEFTDGTFDAFIGDKFCIFPRTGFDGILISSGRTNEIDFSSEGEAVSVGFNLKNDESYITFTSHLLRA